MFLEFIKYSKLHVYSHTGFPVSLFLTHSTIQKPHDPLVSPSKRRKPNPFVSRVEYIFLLALLSETPHIIQPKNISFYRFLKTVFFEAEKNI
jgi:hypothetical protein